MSNGRISFDRVPPSESTSDSESSMDASSDSDSSDDEGESKLRVVKDEALAVDDDEESGPAITSEAQVRTKNEVVDSDVVVPDIEEIPTTERLEKVGEVMSIVDKVVIVKGTASSILNKGSERALDSDTLLVFDDRKVLGYVRNSNLSIIVSRSTLIRILSFLMYRSMKPLAPRTSPSIRSGSARNSLWTQKKSKFLAKSSMSPRVVNLYLSTKSKPSKGAMQVMLMMKNPGMTNLTSPMMRQSGHINVPWSKGPS